MSWLLAAKDVVSEDLFRYALGAMATALVAIALAFARSQANRISSLKRDMVALRKKLHAVEEAARVSQELFTGMLKSSGFNVTGNETMAELRMELKKRRRSDD